ERVCYALAALGAKGEAMESALVKLCRDDWSIDVRVAAALALNGSSEEDAVATFKLGLHSAEHPWVRETCEDELEKRGKLELPLPEDLYSPVTYEEFQKMKQDKWYRIERLIEINGMIYFEARENPPHSPGVRHWYRAKK